MSKLFTKTTIALIFLVVVWGASWPIYKLALQYTPPLLFSGLRATIGGILLGVLLFKRRDKINWNKNWKLYVISALFNTFLFFGIQTVGLNYLPGGLFSILVYFQPVLLGLFAWIWLGEFMTPLKIVGLLIGFIGIVIVSLDGLTFHVSVIGVSLGLISAVCWALGVIFVKKVSDTVDPYWMVSLQSIIGGIALLGTGTLFEKWSDIIWNSRYMVGLSYGAIFGISLTFLIYYKLINEGEASKVGSFTFLVPIIAVILGAVFLDEPVTYLLIVGLILVGLSILIVNYKSKEKLENTFKNNVHQIKEGL
ncbi:drug/metabolite transporter (DMT)-like permease [Psychrobacillus insolitus]|uniref:Drug/metabolite transporter (DMT)-like permease n=1 Tax=Psychrobacillus insolitus TaxID=1461 RepID=A0A2W7MLK0_9BACI|nr:DMT family transporter [Psychrobacillus insolitus]PZX07650.1 drug/metabolite transporter (DMT)-like permease [Psychrobacillus insolitus]